MRKYIFVFEATKRVVFCCGSFPHAFCSHHQAILQLSAVSPAPSDTVYLQLCQIPQVKGSVPQDCTPTPFRHRFQVQVVTCAADGLDIQGRLHGPLLRSDYFARGASRTRRNSSLGLHPSRVHMSTSTSSPTWKLSKPCPFVFLLRIP